MYHDPPTVNLVLTCGGTMGEVGRAVQSDDEKACGRMGKAEITTLHDSGLQDQGFRTEGPSDYIISMRLLSDGYAVGDTAYGHWHSCRLSVVSFFPWTRSRRTASIRYCQLLARFFSIKVLLLPHPPSFPPSFLWLASASSSTALLS